MARKTRRLPHAVLIYQCDELDNGEPVFAVARNLNEIPDAFDGTEVSTYTLANRMTFRLSRELK